MQVEIKSRYLKSIQVGKLDAKISADGTRILRYYIDVQNKLLNVHKELSAPELFLLQHKVDTLMAQWDEKGDEFTRRSMVSAGKGAAEAATIDALSKLDGIANILRHTLKVDNRIVWDTLKDHSTFSAAPFASPRPRVEAAVPADTTNAE